MAYVGCCLFIGRGGGGRLWTLIRRWVYKRGSEGAGCSRAWRGRYHRQQRALLRRATSSSQTDWIYCVNYQNGNLFAINDYNMPKLQPIAFALSLLLRQQRCLYRVGYCSQKSFTFVNLIDGNTCTCVVIVSRINTVCSFCTTLASGQTECTSMQLITMLKMPKEHRITGCKISYYPEPQNTPKVDQESVYVFFFMCEPVSSETREALLLGGDIKSFWPWQTGCALPSPEDQKLESGIAAVKRSNILGLTRLSSNKKFWFCKLSLHLQVQEVEGQVLDHFISFFITSICEGRITKIFLIRKILQIFSYSCKNLSEKLFLSEL